MAMEMIRRGRPLSAILCTVVVLSLAGCGNGAKRVSVSGTVTLDGEPLQGGVLCFSPDAAKGNTARVSCTAPVRAGQYELRTSGTLSSDSGSGAPQGWYKVTLLSNTPGQSAIKVNSKYTDEATTPLSVEVVPSPAPGAYDFKLTK